MCVVVRYLGLGARCGAEVGPVTGSTIRASTVDGDLELEAGGSVAKLACNFCGEEKSRIWFCRQCRLHFCGDCAGGSFITFACPKGHRDVAKVAG